MSNSLRMHERFRERLLVRRGVSAIYIVLMLAYLSWRMTIINWDSLALSLTYLAAELIGFVLGLTVIFSSWTYNHRTPPAAQPGLKVDVFIPAYKEPLSIIRRTLIAAKEITYPHETYLLDDGRREDLKQLAAGLGVHYLSRPHNTHAKAGNLNFGLAHSKASFAAVFDADHIPRPHALDALLGFFADPVVAMVQAPQDYYNTDAFQYLSAKKSGELWHDQSFFYNIAQPCRDAMNAASCAGTSAIYRRAALDAIGGIPEETVTEDLHTSLKLHKAGFKVVYLNEPIAYGAAAVDLAEYYKTRHRWAHGNVHVLRIENAAFTPLLTWRQRLSYLTLGLIYLEGWQQLLLFAVPVAALLMGLPPFEITVFNVLIVLLFPAVTHLLLQELGCGFSRYWANEIFAMARFPVHIAAAAALFRGKMAWRSSSKAMKGAVSWPLLIPQITVAATGLLALGVGTARLAEQDFATGPLAGAAMTLAARCAGLFGPGTAAADSEQTINWFESMSGGYTVDLVAVAGFWVLFNCARAVMVIAKAVRAASNTHEDFRFRVPLVMSWTSNGVPHYARVNWTSEDHLELAIDGPLASEPGSEITGLLHLPCGPIPVTLDQIANRVSSRTGATFEARYRWHANGGREQLSRCLFSVDWHRELRGRAAYFLTPFSVVYRLLRLDFDSFRTGRPWSPVLIRTAPGSVPRLAAMRTSRGSDKPNEILMFGGDALNASAELVFPCYSRVTVERIPARPGELRGKSQGPHLDPQGVRKYGLREVSRFESLRGDFGGPRVGPGVAPSEAASTIGS